MRLKSVDEEISEPPKRGRWKRWAWITVIVVLGGVIALEWAVSTLIASKLRTMVAGKLDAQLHLGATIYIPPYGAMIWTPQLIRGQQTIFSASRVKLSLAEFPRKNKPLIISSLRMSAPQLSLTPVSFKNIGKPSPAPAAPKKLSDVLRLSDVHLFDGRITWRDPARGGLPPMVWDGLALDMDTVQRSVSNYSFHLLSRAGVTADASAVGEFDVDSLIVALRTLSLKVHAEPEPIRSPLPQAIQQVLKKYSINGSLSIDGSGAIPLRDTNGAAFSATISLDDGLAQLPAANWSIDHAVADMTADKQPNEPVVINVQSVDLGSAGKTLHVNKAKLVVDGKTQHWALSDCDGRVVINRPSVEVSPTTVPTSETGKFDFAGRADFSITASAPMRITGKPWENIDHEIILYPRGASFLPKDFAHRIEDVGGGEIRIKNGTIIFQELSGRYGDDSIRLRSARLPIDGLPKLAKWQEISAVVNFHQPMRRYSLKLDKYFDVLNPDGPFLFAGWWSVDKRGLEAKHDFELLISSDRGRFDLTSHHIPLTKIRGDATMTPGAFQLHGVEAELLTGRTTLTGQWVRIDKTQGKFDGDITMSAVDLGRLADISDNPPDVKVKGKLYGQATFTGETTAQRPQLDWTNALRASGEVEIVDGDLFKLPVLKDVFENIKSLRQAATVGDAAAIFDVADQKIVLRDAAVNAPVAGLDGGGSVGFDGSLDLHVIAAPLADWRDRLREMKIPIVSNVAGEVAGAVQKLLNTATGTLLYEFRIGGNVHDTVEVNTVPAPILTDTAATVFGRMLNPQHGQHPLDWFDRGQK